MTNLLDLGIRRRLHGLVREYPGLHVRELARQLETSVALVEYHVAILRDNGLVRTERDERYVRVYPAGDEPKAAEPTKADKSRLALLRERWPLRVTLHLLDHGEAQQHKDIAAALELGKSKLSFHLRKLEAAGIVRKTEDGRFDVVDRAHLLRLLLEFQPTPDLRQEFADVWLSLYGK